MLKGKIELKKIIAVFLVVLITIGFAGCGKNEEQIVIPYGDQSLNKDILNLKPDTIKENGATGSDILNTFILTWENNSNIYNSVNNIMKNHSYQPGNEPETFESGEVHTWTRVSISLYSTKVVYNVLKQEGTNIMTHKVYAYYPEK